MTAPIVTMREALSRPDYFGRQLGGDTWSKWRVLLIAIAGEPLTDDELVVFFALTNRQKQPEGRPREFWGVIGRRGGKSRAMAVWRLGLRAAMIFATSLHRGKGDIFLSWLRLATRRPAHSISFAASSLPRPHCVVLLTAAPRIR